MRLSEMKKHYPTQQHCFDLLEELAWNYRPRCPDCGGKTILGTYRTMYKGKHGYRCGNCRITYNVTTGTMLHWTRIPLVKWFTAIHIIKTFRRLPSSPKMSSLLDVSCNAALRMRAKIKEDLESDHGSLSNRIYQHNRKYEPEWY